MLCRSWLSCGAIAGGCLEVCFAQGEPLPPPAAQEDNHSQVAQLSKVHTHEAMLACRLAQHLVYNGIPKGPHEATLSCCCCLLW